MNVVRQKVKYTRLREAYNSKIFSQGAACANVPVLVPESV